MKKNYVSEKIINHLYAYSNVSKVENFTIKEIDKLVLKLVSVVHRELNILNIMHIEKTEELYDTMKRIKSCS